MNNWGIPAWVENEGMGSALDSPLLKDVKTEDNVSIN
jgi:hypothetical protein